MFCPPDMICERWEEVSKFIGSQFGLPVHVEEDVGLGFDHRLLVGQRHGAVVEVEPAPFVSRVGSVVAGADSENKRQQTERAGNCTLTGSPATNRQRLSKVSEQSVMLWIWHCHAPPGPFHTERRCTTTVPQAGSQQILRLTFIHFKKS